MQGLVRYTIYFMLQCFILFKHILLGYKVHRKGLGPSYSATLLSSKKNSGHVLDYNDTVQETLL